MQSLKLFIFFLTCIISLINVQADIDYDFFDIETKVNSEYLIDEESYITNNNHGIFTNFTIIKRYPDDTKVTFDAIGSSMGEYIVKTGLFVQAKFCDMFEPQYQFLGKQAKKLGFVKEDCPPSPNIYGVENFEPDLSSFPDNFMPNNYVVIVKLASETVFISEFKLYVRVN